MNKFALTLWIFVLSTVARGAPREEWFRNLSLESAVAASDLVLAAQVSAVTEIKLMRGGKGESAMFQCTFKPARVLKGVFARAELSLGSGDLGLFRADDAKHLEQGAFVLIFLGRSDVGYRNSNRSDNGSSAQSIPPLRDVDDPLLGAVRTLLAVNSEGDRNKRVSLLVDGLKTATGPGAVALLESLRNRSLLAAQNAQVPRVVDKLLTDASAAVRESAAQTLRSILEADYLEQAPLRESAVTSSIEALELADPTTFARAAMMRVLGAAGDAAVRNEQAMAQLHRVLEDEGYAITAERAAGLRALGDSKAEAAGAGVEAALRRVPLDDDGEYSRAAEYAITRLQPGKAAALLNSRIALQIASGLDARIEIESMAHLPPAAAIPVLVEVEKLALKPDEKAALAETCWTLAQKEPDGRLVQVLSGLLEPDEQSREAAVGALLKIDSESAAKALQPHLREEQNLHRKLEIAEMLGRHGIRDGYVFAIEHVSEPWLLEQAVAALAAIREPQAVARLKEILETSNDLAWNTAAVRGLGAMGELETAPRFLGMIEDLRNPLAPAALIALADLGEVRALDKAREGIASRNDRMVVASARAIGKLLARPGVGAPDLKAKLLALFVDSDAEEGSRTAALDALLALRDERLDLALPRVVREAAIENGVLLGRVERLMRERRVKL